MKQHRTGLLAEFRQFIARGNVTELAVGVIIGGAFQSIVNSLTADIIMPVVGIFVSESTFSNLSLSIGSAVIQYGNFIQAVLNFLITALAPLFFHQSCKPPAPEKGSRAAACTAGAFRGRAPAGGNPGSSQGPVSLRPCMKSSPSGIP